LPSSAVRFRSRFASAERFVESIKSKCLAQIVLRGAIGADALPYHQLIAERTG
jgi:hypothetical protein